MALQRDERRIGVQANNGPGLANAPGVSFSVAGAGSSAGSALSSLGNTLISGAEARMAAEGEQRMIDAAYAAPLLKDPQTGAYIRPATPPGGWQWQIKFTDIIDDRMANLLQVDLETTLNNLATSNLDNPDAYNEKATSAVSGLMDGLEPKLQGRLLPIAQREQSQRYGALSDRKARIENEAMRTEIKVATAKSAEGAFAAMNVGEEIVVQEQMTAFRQKWDRQVELGMIDDPAGDPNDRSADAIAARDAKFAEIEIGLRVQSQIYRTIGTELTNGTLDPNEIERMQIALSGFGDVGGEGSFGGWTAAKLARSLPDEADRKSLSERLGALATNARSAATETAKQRDFAVQSAYNAAGGMGTAPNISEARAQEWVSEQMREQGLGFDADSIQAIVAQTGIVPVEMLKPLVTDPRFKTKDQLKEGLKVFNALSGLINPDSGQEINRVQSAVKVEDIPFWNTLSTYAAQGEDFDKALELTNRHLNLLAESGKSEDQIIAEKMPQPFNRPKTSVRDLITKTFDLDSMPTQLSFRIQREATTLLAAELSAPNASWETAQTRVFARMQETYSADPKALGGWGRVDERVPAISDPIDGNAKGSQEWVNEYLPVLAEMADPEQAYDVDVGSMVIGENAWFRPVGGGRNGQFYVYAQPAENENIRPFPLRGKDGAFLVVDLGNAAEMQEKHRKEQQTSNANLQQSREAFKKQEGASGFLDWLSGTSAFGDGPEPSAIVKGIQTSLRELERRYADGLISEQTYNETRALWEKRLAEQPDLIPLEEPTGDFDKGLITPDRSHIDPGAVFDRPPEDEPKTRGIKPKSDEPENHSAVEPISADRFLNDTAGIADELIEYADSEPLESDEEFIRDHIVRASYLPDAPTDGSSYGSVPADFLPMYAAASKVSGIPTEILIAQGAVESIDFDPKVVAGIKLSPKGAGGVAQFMPATAKSFGVDITDPASSIDGQGRFMKVLMDKYKNVPEALAAYNMGETKYDRYKKDGRTLPQETRGYVQKIMGKAGRFRGATAGGGDKIATNVTISFQGKALTKAQLRGVDPDVISLALSAYEAIGEANLDIVSGFRDPDQNKKAKGAKKSQHMHGNALDLNTTGWSRARKLELIDALSRAGAGGIGVYANNIHVDIAGKRAWGPTFLRVSVPKWAEAAIRVHEGRRGGGRSQTFTTKASNAFRNKNPAGIRGATHTANFNNIGESGGQLVFKTAYDGMAALGKTFTMFEQQGINTPNLFVDNFMPMAPVDERKAMAELIGKVAGVGTDSEMNLSGNIDQATKVALALIARESNGMPYKAGFVRAALSQAMEPTEGEKAAAKKKLKENMPADPSQRQFDDRFNPGRPFPVPGLPRRSLLADDARSA